MQLSLLILIITFSLKIERYIWQQNYVASFFVTKIFANRKRMYCHITNSNQKWKCNYQFTIHYIIGFTLHMRLVICKGGTPLYPSKLKERVQKRLMSDILSSLKYKLFLFFFQIKLLKFCFYIAHYFHLRRRRVKNQIPSAPKMWELLRHCLQMATPMWNSIGKKWDQDQVDPVKYIHFKMIHVTQLTLGMKTAN